MAERPWVFKCSYPSNGLPWESSANQDEKRTGLKSIAQEMAQAVSYAFTTDRLMLCIIYKRFQVAGLELLTCQNLLNRWQFQNHTQYPGHGAMAPQDMVIKNKVL